MNMHQGLDLSRFKKVSSDKKTTTLRHSKGHEIKIAHSGLTPKMKERLESLEMHEDAGKKPKKYAEGTPDGVVGDEQSQALDPSSPAPTSDGSAPASMPNIPGWVPEPFRPGAQPLSTGSQSFVPAPDAQGIAPSPAAPSAPASPMGREPVPEQPDAPLPRVDKAEPNPVAAEVASKETLPESVGLPAPPAVQEVRQEIGVQTPPRKTAAEIAAELNANDLEWQRDLDRGKITPETYRSLYAKRDTLGKVGMIFGMIVAGAGSGLTKQPNSLLEMLNKEIENDLDAQKKTKDNAWNFYQLAKKQTFERQKMDAEVEQMRSQSALLQEQAKRQGAETDILREQVKKVPAEIAKLEAETLRIPSEVAGNYAQAKALNADANIKDMTRASTMAMSAAYQYVMDSIKKLPDGPEKERQLQAAGMLYQAMQEKIQEKNAHAAGMIEFINTMSGSNQQQPQAAADGEIPPLVNYDLLERKKIMGERKMPKGMSPSDIEAARKEEEQIKGVVNMAKMYSEVFDRLDKAKFAGFLTPDMRAAEINLLNAALARDVTGRFVTEEAKQQIFATLPTAWDNIIGDARKRKKLNTMQLFKDMYDKTPALDRFGLKTPWVFDAEGHIRQPNGKIEQAGDKKPKPKEGSTGKTKDGRPVIFRNGKWEPK